MGHYTLDKMIARWGREELTPEQMIGQMLQVLRIQEQRLREFERRLPPTTRGRVVDVLELKHEPTEPLPVTVVNGDHQAQ